MWILAKFKSSELSIMIDDLKRKIGREIEIYQPHLKIKKFKNNKIRIQKKSLLGDYIFLSHKNLNEKYYLNRLDNIKGIKFCFKNSLYTQKDLINFIERCKKNTIDGFITQSFFEIIQKRNIFISGPFSNLIFEILEERKNTLKVLIGNFKTSVKKGTDYLYKPI